jgi:hypothetical protein
VSGSWLGLGPTHRRLDLPFAAVIEVRETTSRLAAEFGPAPTLIVGKATKEHVLIRFQLFAVCPQPGAEHQAG